MNLNVIADSKQVKKIFFFFRNKRSLAVNMKCQEGIEIVKKLCKNADVLIEGYRPGVMEKLGLSPSVLHELNSRLIYTRLTGYGQNGSLAFKAGHDINYLAVSGVLSVSLLGAYCSEYFLGNLRGGDFYFHIRE